MVDRLIRSLSAGLLALLAAPSCRNSENTSALAQVEDRARLAQQIDGAQSTKLESLSRRVASLQTQAHRVSKVAAEASRQFHDAQLAYSAAAQDTDRVSAHYQEVERQYQVASTNYRLLAALLDYADHPGGVAAFLCSQLAATAHDAAGEAK